MPDQYIYITCPNCGGDGEVKPPHKDSPPATCTNCNGTGQYLWGTIKDEIIGAE